LITKKKKKKTGEKKGPRFDGLGQGEDHTWGGKQKKDATPGHTVQPKVNTRKKKKTGQELRRKTTNTHLEDASWLEKSRKPRGRK